MDSPKKLLRKYEISPKKRLGQHFLIDQDIIEKIIDLSRISSQDNVLEIGTGLGHLTQALARRCKKVIGFESDPLLYQVSVSELNSLQNIEIHNLDVMSPEVWEGLKERSITKVVSNLPYYLSSSLIYKFMEYKETFKDLTLTLQKEVAERITAPPGGKQRGKLSVICQCFYHIDSAFNISRYCFFPMPDVDSTSLRFLFKPSHHFSKKMEAFFKRVVGAAFGHRRKTMFNSLRQSDLGIASARISGLLKSLGIDLKRRAETFSVDEFIELTEALFTPSTRL